MRHHDEAETCQDVAAYTMTYYPGINIDNSILCQPARYHEISEVQVTQFKTTRELNIYEVTRILKLKIAVLSHRGDPHID
jgi:hypothetical protein